MVGTVRVPCNDDVTPPDRVGRGVEVAGPRRSEILQRRRRPLYDGIRSSNIRVTAVVVAGEYLDNDDGFIFIRGFFFLSIKKGMVHSPTSAYNIRVAESRLPARGQRGMLMLCAAPSRGGRRNPNRVLNIAKYREAVQHSL